jgi:hypothetical protein
VGCIPGTRACIALDSSGQIASSVGGTSWSGLTIADPAGGAVGLSCWSSGGCAVLDPTSVVGSGS